jgi:hypothetical protein
MTNPALIRMSQVALEVVVSLSPFVVEVRAQWRAVWMAVATVNPKATSQFDIHGGISVDCYTVPLISLSFLPK